MTIEDVETILDETQESAEYQRVIHFFLMESVLLSKRVKQQTHPCVSIFVLPVRYIPQANSRSGYIWDYMIGRV